MEESFNGNVKVPNVFGDQEVHLTLYKGVTVFVGANGTGKTQTLKALKSILQRQGRKTRYLSSNRIGMMEQFRSKCNQYNYNLRDFSLGGRELKKLREEIETATGDFFTMDACRDVYIKVSERLNTLFGRQVFLRWDEGNLKVYLARTKTQKEYSIAAEASGLVNVIAILAALYDNEVKFLLIDEPEVSLHPQLQAYLLREIQMACDLLGKTVVLSTHSAEMVEINKAEDICRYVFFVDGKAPYQVLPTEEVLKSKKLQEFLLRMGEIYKIGLFAKKVLLIEGVSDLIVCKAIAKKLSLAIEAAGSQIIPVDGKGQFPIVAKLFRLLGKEVSVMTDLDGFLDDDSVVGAFDVSEAANTLANIHGARTMTEVVSNVKSWIGTIVNGSPDKYKDLYKTHPYYVKEKEEAIKEDSSFKIIKRALIAELFVRNEDELKKLPDGSSLWSLRTQLSSVLDYLEELELFVLRKGAIESYYCFGDGSAYEDKPSHAVQEAEGIAALSNDKVEKQYDVLVRALKQAAKTDQVDESHAVRNELLSEAALALDVLAQKGDKVEKNDIISAIMQTKGSRDSLFDYKLINEGGRRGMEISLNVTTLRVGGMPLKLFVGDNVNVVVQQVICSDASI